MDSLNTSSIVLRLFFYSIAMFGEAVIIINESFKMDFRYYIKQRGGLLAKGRLLSVQFENLFEDVLYYEISQHAVEMATILRRAFSDNEFSLRYASTSNQLFPILPTYVIVESYKRSEEIYYVYKKKNFFNRFF